MRTKQILFVAFALILMTSFVLAENNSSSPATELNESQPAGNTSSPSTDQNTSSPADEGNTSSPSICGDLIYFCSDNSPYCNLVRPEIDKYIDNSGCVEVKEHIISDFMDLKSDSLALKYKVDYVPAFIFIDENGCSGEVGFGGATKYTDIKNNIENFVCGQNPSSPSNPSTPSTPECPPYTCEGGFKPKCQIVNNQCSCESCPAIPIEPNETTGPIEIPEPENNQTINYQCSGCTLEKQCYPFGYRKNGNFCSDINNQFIEQKKADSSCENNFECSTNLCIDSQCVSSGLWQKFVRWLSKIFG